MSMRKRFTRITLPLLGFALLVAACTGTGEDTQSPAAAPATAIPAEAVEESATIVLDEQASSRDVSDTEAAEDEASSTDISREEVAEEADAPPTRLPADKYADLEIVTLLPRDGIPAIDNPQFLTVADADEYYDPDELVIGVDFNGEARAYSVPYLSNHEIVNDNVGGVKIAVTW